MQIINVKLAQNKYEVHIGPGLIRKAGEKLHGLGLHGRAAVVTNPAVRSLYGDVLEADLKAAGLTPVMLEVPEGEKYKSLEQASGLFERLSDNQAERLTPVLALGGGVIGDLAGFVAATYMRGVPLVHLPTTLLAQVDSSLGGKTGVNHGKLKNVIGAFYQPRLVISDIATLKTLPEEEFKNGLAEVIKYAVIRDAELFQRLETNLERLEAREMGMLEAVISRCAAIKAEIVEKDENDLGIRNILNYGHTVGHAVETAADFHIGHGRAVAIGMMAEARMAREMDILPRSGLERIRELLVRVGLPVKIPGLDIDGILRAMGHDKKKAGGRLRFALPRAVGQACLSDEVDAGLAKEVLRDLNEETPNLR
jgi:3-dehydroquinate synthase